MAAFEYLYLHGFRSSTGTTKGAIVKERLVAKGVALEMFDAKGGKGHHDTTVSIGLEALDAHYQRNKKPLRLIGSSMGGFISAFYASKYPSHVDRVVLINPAVNLKETWSTIADTEDPSVLEKWKADGVMTFPVESNTEEADIPFAYVEDSLQYPSYPNVKCPSLVFVGTQDDIIPPKYGYVLQLEQELPDLMKVIELDDDHDFTRDSTIDRFIPEVMDFFGLS